MTPPPRNGSKKPLLVAVALVATLLVALPAVISAQGDDHGNPHDTAARASLAALPAMPSETSPSTKAPKSPSAKPSSTKKNKKKTASPKAAAPASASKAAPPTKARPRTTKAAAPKTPGTVNRALGGAVWADSATQDYVGSHLTDGDATTYWESANGAFPHTIRVDLGSERTISKLVLKLPPGSDWNSRTQTLAVYGSDSLLVPAASYTFDAASGNTVTIRFDPASTRSIELRFTANSGWPAAQLSELAAY
ncbi:discoidin domain-containing protein [Streptomyces sp. NPDC007095]|uniref:galactose-binding domain-containing protein n=1 Tax=Streptomyces sp. NPDC007095 TaxID=3154482 RepID=UPI00340B96D9